MKILVVDDSIVYRSAISQALSEVPGYNVFKTCSNGKIAIDFLKQNPDTDLITLDLEMPVMDGMETIKNIRAFNKDVSIIVFSATSIRGAEKTIDALTLGANDFVTKVEGQGTIESSLGMIRDELVPKINALRATKENKNSLTCTDRPHVEKIPIKERLGYKPLPQTQDVDKIVESMSIKPKLLCIGCSTGGPEALTEIFKNITEKPSFPILLVQHMPPLFTKKLAEMLNKHSVVDVREAEGGEKLEPGVCYIAPGNYHMVIDSDKIVRLNQDEKVCFVRPAVDVLYKSVSENFSDQIMSIILTGMGEDGAAGCKYLDKKGSYFFIQDEESSVVWGMPGAVSRTGLNVNIIELKNIGTLISKVSKRI